MKKNPIDLAGKSVVLTGANGILGRRYVRAYLDAGVKVAALDLSVDGLTKHPRLFAQAVNLTDRAAVSAAFASALKRFGRIDGIHHNCAGKAEGFFDSFEDYRLDTWRSVLASNIETALPLTQCAIVHFKKRKSGSILFTASIYGVVGADQRIYEGSSYMGRAINTPAVYSTSKAAVIGLTKYLAAYFADKNIRVNCLSPTGVFNNHPEEFVQKLSNIIPMGRMAHIDEYKGAIVFLCSNASSYMKGHNLVIDGGKTVW